MAMKTQGATGQQAQTEQGLCGSAIAEAPCWGWGFQQAGDISTSYRVYPED